MERFCKFVHENMWEPCKSTASSVAVEHLPNTVYYFYRKEVLQHKTFHRYTVRAKRGTAQGLRDSQNRSHTPKSAGAALRRHNEAALVKARLVNLTALPLFPL